MRTPGLVRRVLWVMILYSRCPFRSSKVPFPTRRVPPTGLWDAVKIRKNIFCLTPVTGWSGSPPPVPLGSHTLSRYAYPLSYQVSEVDCGASLSERMYLSYLPPHFSRTPRPLRESGLASQDRQRGGGRAVAGGSGEGAPRRQRQAGGVRQSASRDDWSSVSHRSRRGADVRTTAPHHRSATPPRVRPAYQTEPASAQVSWPAGPNGRIASRVRCSACVRFVLLMSR